MRVIEGQGVILRTVRRDDLEMMQKWSEDGELIKYLGDKLSRWRDADERYGSLLRDRRRRVLAIETRDGILIGDIELMDITWRTGSAELKICIGERNYWNRGLGTAAVRALLEHAFTRLNLQRIHLRVYANNQRAIRCYEKCGFRKEGVLRAGFRRLEGQGDLVLMSIERTPFLARFAS